jgi:WD40 repeat protein
METQKDVEKVGFFVNVLCEKHGIDIQSSHLDAVRALAFHPTELCLATGGDDCTVKIWRMEVASLASSA